MLSLIYLNKSVISHPIAPAISCKLFRVGLLFILELNALLDIPNLSAIS